MQVLFEKPDSGVQTGIGEGFMSERAVYGDKSVKMTWGNDGQI